MIWYRKNVPDEDTNQVAGVNGQGQSDGERQKGKQKQKDVPPLHAKRKLGVFRTRSKLERDAWVWAINVEIEKVVRASREREEAVRQAGQLLRT